MVERQRVQERPGVEVSRLDPCQTIASPFQLVRFKPDVVAVRRLEEERNRVQERRTSAEGESDSQGDSLAT